MTTATLTTGTKVRVSDAPTTLPYGGYVSPNVAGKVGTVTSEVDSSGNVRVTFDRGDTAGVGEQLIDPAHLEPITDDESAPVPLKHADKVGRVVIVRTPDTNQLVWFYVIAALPDGNVYGVNVGNNSAYLAPEGDGMRFQTAKISGTTNNSLSRLESPVRDALASFLGSSGVSLETETGESTEEAFERGKREQRAADVQEFEAWKESATETAHRYANNNSLCSEFDRCMTDIGLRPRRRDYEVEVTLTYTTTVTVEADDADDAGYVVREDPWSYIDLTYGVRDHADVEIGDVERV